MKKRKILVVFLVVVTLLNMAGCSWFDLPKEVYNRKSQFEYHHVFPQEYYGDEGNNVTVKMRNFEHYRWVHSRSNFDEDWEDTDSSFWGDIDAYAEREAAFIAGTNFVSYRWLAYEYGDKSITDWKPLFAMHFDGVSNLIYNISYITSIPYKLIHFTGMCIESSSDFGVWNSVKMFVWMLLQLVYGFISAAFMLIFGTLIGAIYHPLQTLGNLTINLAHPIRCNLLVSILEILGAIFRPLIRIFFRV